MKKEKKILVVLLLMALIIPFSAYLFEPIISDVALSAKEGSFDYLWKLDNRNTIGMIFVWPIFLLGFLFIFVATQIYGITQNKNNY